MDRGDAALEFNQDMSQGRRILIAAKNLSTAKEYADSHVSNLMCPSGMTIHTRTYRNNGVACHGMSVDKVYIVNSSSLRAETIEVLGMCCRTAAPIIVIGGIH